MKLFLKKFKEIVKKHRNFLLFAHDNIDPDALGSIIAMEEFLRKNSRKKIEIKIYDSKFSKQSRKLLNFLNLTLNVNKELPKKPFLSIILDAQSFPKVFSLRDKRRDLPLNNTIIIDHHVKTQSLIEQVPLQYIDSSSQSNCEIITSFFRESRLKPSSNAARSLIAGILYDTRFLQHASNDTIKNLNFLLNKGVALKDIRDALSSQADISEKIARLKAATRMEIIRVEDIIILTSRVSSFEASACRALITLGGDIAIVIARDKEKIRISSRQSNYCYNKYKVNLAKIMNDVGFKIKGNGGGHKMAAAANGIENENTDVKKIMDFLIISIKNVILNNKKN
ncbi:MAG: DHH family phosphoesterase [Promethearchaeota archaeon]